MKKTTAVLFASFFFVSAFAQIEKPSEITTAMSTGTAIGWKIFIPEAKQKDVLKAWKKQMTDFDAKTSKVKKSNDYFSDEVKISGLGEKPIDIFFQCSEENQGVYANLFLQRDGNFLGKSAPRNEVSFIENFLVNFAKNQSKSAIKESLENQEKDLEKRQKEYEKLIEDKSKYEEDIKEAEELIAERKRMIAQNIKDQESKKQEISKQESIITSTKTKLDRFR